MKCNVSYKVLFNSSRGLLIRKVAFSSVGSPLADKKSRFLSIFCCNEQCKNYFSSSDKTNCFLPFYPIVDVGTLKEWWFSQ